MTESPLDEDWTSAFTHPDPLDPNDAQRQRTQSRAGSYPYDMPVSYGKAIGTDMDGAAYQVGSDDDKGDGPLAREDEPYTRPMTVWDRVADALDRDIGIGRRVSNNVEIGPAGKDANALGYGNHGTDAMGEGGMDPWDLELDALRKDFRTSFMDTLPDVRRMPKRDLFSLLVDLDPEYAADKFAPEDDAEMLDTYTGWGAAVCDPEEDDYEG